MALPPAQPSYILRGHSSQIHAVAFVRSNSRLVTCDAVGWAVLWDLAVKRATAVWRAHEGAILAVKDWGRDKLITHGKDNKLIVWRLSEEDEASMSNVLPVDTPTEPRKQPWLLHIIDVNTMNFCAFAQLEIDSTNDSKEDELLMAVPNILTSESVDIFHLPSAHRLHTIPASSTFKGGMVMALSLFHHPVTKALLVIASFESGHTSISQLSANNPKWTTIYTSKSHTQPALSLDVSASRDYYLTSSADALIVKHPINACYSPPPLSSPEPTPLRTLNTKHSGQQSLRIRNDGLLFATAGWDSKIRVYSTKSLKEVAVLKWHKEGCYALSFADVAIPEEGTESVVGENGLNQPRSLDDSKKDAKQDEKEMVKRAEYSSKLSVRDERARKAKTTHWLAAGSKDGKVSLWDIF